ncbi:armadillo-type protein [Polychytrium aggregatum]|uniref:armadillo-type protein n=1 Tax=Polychytrium aggregatum TaxID=110093 RepID=UPI0022FE113A|nr:armadillo-type protein [Polychytrium aggregatum]KAI9193580.1 armadillo-type protein [Polychytrium aggregatum]
MSEDPSSSTAQAAASQASDFGRWEQKKELHKKNTDAHAHRPDLSTFGNLDSSIKKNNSFIKKLRVSLSMEQLPSLTKELLGLKLEKYISEVVTAICEAKLKNSADVWAAVEICSLLHQRFADFSPMLTTQLQRQLGPPPSYAGVNPEQRERDENARISKLRPVLRLFTELYVVAVIVDNSNSREFILQSIFKDLFAVDKNHFNLPLAATFVKFFGDQFLGSVTPKRRDSTTSSSSSPTRSADAGSNEHEPAKSLVAQPVQNVIRTLLTDYFNSVSDRLVLQHKYVRNMEKENHEYFIARGEITEDRTEKYEKAMKNYDRVLVSTQVLAEYLGTDMPELPEDEKITRVGGIIVPDGSKEKEEQDVVDGPWEDEEQKSFYENLIDLKLFVPGIFLESQPRKKDGDSKPADDDLETPTSAQPIHADEGAEAVSILNEDEDGDKKGKATNSSQILLDTLLGRLPTAMNRDTIDKVAVDFCFRNSKGARKRLAKVLVSVPRQRLDLLPYYARLIATVHPFMPDIASAVLEQLENDFQHFQRKKDQNLLEERVKNIRFLSELTKFKITPQHVIFHCLKVCLDDFNGTNIEIACNLLETCGRFLFKTPETNVRTSNMLDIMMRKKNIQHVDNRQALMIENAFYQCNPPNRPATSARERSPLEQYYKKLIYSDLSKRTVDKIIKQIRKFDWDNPDTRKMLAKPFFKPWKVKFSNLHLLACIASEMALRYYPDFGVAVVDNTLEEIRMGLELNLFKLNQKRISLMKFLGELYNYRLVDSAVIFETLYLLLQFGHDQGVARPGTHCLLDPPFDFFRVRLVCTLLESCGQCFDKGSSAKKLDHFLIFFQMYLFAKIPPPMDAEFMISDIFELLRPRAKIYESYEEVTAEVTQILLEQAKATQNGDKAALDEEDDDDDDDEDLGPRGGEGDANADADSENESLEDEDVGDELSENGENVRVVDVDDDEVIVHMAEEEYDEEEDLEFEREFNKIMQESLDSRKNERRAPAFDAPIPVKLKKPSPGIQTSSVYRGVDYDRDGSLDEDEAGGESGSGQVVFTLLTKKGNKQQAKAFELPADSDFVINTRSKQEAEQEEKLHLKKLVLSYEEREREERQEETPESTLRGSVSARKGRTVWSNAGGPSGGLYGRRR